MRRLNLFLLLGALAPIEAVLQWYAVLLPDVNVFTGVFLRILHYVFLLMLVLLGINQFASAVIYNTIKEALVGIFLLVGGIVAVIFLYAAEYEKLGLRIAGAGITRDRLDCLYFSVVTWTTVGYGDLLPEGKARLVAGLEALTGYVLMALLIASFITFATIVRDSVRFRPGPS